MEEVSARLSCFEMTLKAGLASWVGTELFRARVIILVSVVNESLGPMLVLLLQFLDKVPNRVLIRFGTSEPAALTDLRFLGDEMTGYGSSEDSYSSKPIWAVEGNVRDVSSGGAHPRAPVYPGSLSVTYPR